MKLKICQFLVIGEMALAFGGVPAFARDNGQWEDRGPNIRAWFQSLMQPDNPLVSCCGEADAVIADSWVPNHDGSITATITDGRNLLLEGTTLHVPAGKIVYQTNNPTGHSIIFYSQVQGVYCFVLGPLR